MERIVFTQYSGKKILHLDFAKCREPKELLESIGNAKQEVSKHAPKSLLVVTDVSDSIFPKELVDAMKELAKSNAPYVKASAIVGITGLKKYIFNTVIQLTGRKISAFDDLLSAKSWLVNQN
jgi:hypothetical protein